MQEEESETTSQWHLSDSQVSSSQTERLTDRQELWESPKRGGGGTDVTMSQAMITGIMLTIKAKR